MSTTSRHPVFLHLLIALALIIWAVLGAHVYAVALHANLNRDSEDYVMVRGELFEWASGNSGVRGRRSTHTGVAYVYAGNRYELDEFECLVSERTLKQMMKDSGYVPVRVHRQNPSKATVDHELTWHAFLPPLTTLLMLLAGLCWLAYGLYRLVKLVKRKRREAPSLRRSRRRGYKSSPWR